MGLLVGCINAQQFAQDVAQVREQRLFFIAALTLAALMTLSFGVWRDSRRRGTYLGVLFGALGEVALVRIVPDGSAERLLLAAGSAALLVIVVSLVRRSGLLNAVLARTRVAKALPGASADGLAATATLHTGLISYFVTLALLMLFDTTISPFVYYTLVSFFT